LNKAGIPDKCYVYVYLDPRKPGHYKYGEYHFVYEPFYVGKGTSDRAWLHLRESVQNKNNNTYFTNKIKNIRRLTGFDPHIIIHTMGMCDESAYVLEERMIDIIGRSNIGTGPLCNLTPGGLGAKCGEDNWWYGKHHTDEAKKKLSISHVGMKASEETKKRMSDSMTGEGNPFYGRKHSESSLKKMSIIQTINNTGEGNPMYGKKHPQERIDRIKESCRKIKPTVDQIERGSKTASKLRYTLIDPEGNEIYVDRVHWFCKERGLCYTSIRNVAQGKYDQYKGWKVFDMTPRRTN